MSETWANGDTIHSLSTFRKGTPDLAGGRRPGDSISGGVIRQVYHMLAGSQKTDWLRSRGLASLTRTPHPCYTPEEALDTRHLNWVYSKLVTSILSGASQ